MEDHNYPDQPALQSQSPLPPESSPDSEVSIPQLAGTVLVRSATQGRAVQLLPTEPPTLNPNEGLLAARNVSQAQQSEANQTLPNAQHDLKKSPSCISITSNHGVSQTSPYKSTFTSPRNDTVIRGFLNAIPEYDGDGALHSFQ
ncbi:unnamed protein product, partial [Rotaria socialis]